MGNVAQMVLNLQLAVPKRQRLVIPHHIASSDYDLTNFPPEGSNWFNTHTHTDKETQPNLSPYPASELACARRNVNDSIFINYQPLARKSHKNHRNNDLMMIMLEAIELAKQCSALWMLSHCVRC